MPTAMARVARRCSEGPVGGSGGSRLRAPGSRPPGGGRGCRASSRSAGGMRAASIGVTVSATKSEIRTEPATVSPNSPRKLPDDPLGEDDGQEDGCDREGGGGGGEDDLPGPIGGRLLAGLPHAAVPLDVLEHDDRVVDHDADGEGQSEQRHRVQGVAEDPDQTEGGDERERDRGGDDQRGPRPPHEDEDDEDRQRAPEEQRELRLPTDSRIEIEKSMYWSSSTTWMPSGRSGRERVDAATDLVDDRDGVGVALLRDGDATTLGMPLKRVTSRTSSTPSSTRATSRRRMVASPRWATTISLERRDRPELRLRLHGPLDLGTLDDPARDVDVLPRRARPARRWQRVRAHATRRCRARSGCCDRGAPRR